MSPLSPHHRLAILQGKTGSSMIFTWSQRRSLDLACLLYRLVVGRSGKF